MKGCEIWEYYIQMIDEKLKNSVKIIKTCETLRKCLTIFLLKSNSFRKLLMLLRFVKRL